MTNWGGSFFILRPRREDIFFLRYSTVLYYRYFKRDKQPRLRKYGNRPVRTTVLLIVVVLCFPNRTYVTVLVQYSTYSYHCHRYRHRPIE